MGIGARKQVQLVKVVATKAVAGNWNDAPEEPYNTWAEVKDSNSMRDYQNGQAQLGSTKIFTVRFRFDLHPNVDWLVRYGGKEWTVTGLVKAEEKKFYWTITARTNEI